MVCYDICYDKLLLLLLFIMCWIINHIAFNESSGDMVLFWVDWVGLIWVIRKRTLEMLIANLRHFDLELAQPNATNHNLAYCLFLSMHANYSDLLILYQFHCSS